MRCGLAPGGVGAAPRWLVREVHGMQGVQHRNTATPQHRNTATPQHRNTEQTAGLGGVNWPLHGACREAVSCVASLWRMAPRHPASHAPKPDAPCCRGLGVRSLVPAPGRAEAGSCRRPGSQGSGPCGWGRWLGRSGWAMPSILSRAFRRGRRRAGSTGAGLRIAPWRVAGVCRPPAVEAGEAAQRSNAAVWPQPQSPSPCCGSGHQGGAAGLVFHLGGAVAQGAGVDVAR